MTKRNNIQWATELSRDNPDFALNRRVRLKMRRVLLFVTQLNLRVYDVLGAPGTKSEEELREIRMGLGNQFGALGRTCTAEVWQWIRQMTSKGYGQMLEFEVIPEAEDMLDWGEI